MSENATDFHVKMSVRGYARTLPGTRVMLLAQVSLPEDGDYEQALEATFPAGVDVQTSFFLLAERNAADESQSALLIVEEADFRLG